MRYKHILIIFDLEYPQDTSTTGISFGDDIDDTILGGVLQEDDFSIQVSFITNKIKDTGKYLNVFGERWYVQKYITTDFDEDIACILALIPETSQYFNYDYIASENDFNRYIMPDIKIKRFYGDVFMKELINSILKFLNGYD